MLQCRECHSTKRVTVKPGISGVTIPRYCEAGNNLPGSEGCGADPFHIVADGSEYVDQQQLKLQVRKVPYINNSASNGCHEGPAGWSQV